MIEINAVNKSFGGLKAVNELNLVLNDGIVFGLVGPNGAGKTTIYNLITGFLKPDTGSITYKGKLLNNMPPNRIANYGIARSFQDLRLFEQMTVLENVLLALPNQPGEQLSRVFLQSKIVKKMEQENIYKAEEYLLRVGLLDRKEVVVHDLSYGEQKLLVIARLLATEAECLLLDEPMSGVDEQTTAIITDLIRSIAGSGRIICLIEHNIDIVTKTCDRLLFLDQGTLLAAGTPEEITSDEHLTKIYFGQ